MNYLDHLLNSGAAAVTAVSAKNTILSPIVACINGQGLPLRQLGSSAVNPARIHPLPRLLPARKGL